MCIKTSIKGGGGKEGVLSQRMGKRPYPLEMRKSQNIRLQSAVAALAHRRRRYGEKPPDRFNRILRLILSALYFLPLGIAEYALAAWIVEISNSYTQGAENAKENHG